MAEKAVGCPPSWMAGASFYFSGEVGGVIVNRFTSRDTVFFYFLIKEMSKTVSEFLLLLDTAVKTSPISQPGHSGI